jgi:hypothetical protein
MHFASARDYLRLMRRWQWPARQEFGRWGRRARAQAARGEVRGDYYS